MINIIDKIDCCGCQACSTICPQKSITMQADSEGFYYPLLNIAGCTECGLCEQACPILSKPTVAKPGVAYACMNKDATIRQQSSSGGVFTILAESVIAHHGVVFGAGFDGDFNVVHSWTNRLDGLAIFRGSKYVQSYLGDSYQQVGDFLKQGVPVLFSGTPCQIAGLRSYLDKDAEGLICLDIICHGVPSPLVWLKYRSRITNERKIKTVNFRDKTLGWKRFSLRATYDNAEYIKDLSTDEFMQGFLQNLYLRPSCYHCNFKTLRRHSDITLADFWGIENIIPNFDDDRGTSLILVNSQKGKALLASVVHKMDYEQVDIDQALLYNSTAIKSVDYNSKRNHFFQELAGTQDIIQLINKYTKGSFFENACGRLRTLPGRIKKKLLGE